MRNRTAERTRPRLPPADLVDALIQERWSAPARDVLAELDAAAAGFERSPDHDGLLLALFGRAVVLADAEAPAAEIVDAADLVRDTAAEYRRHGWAAAATAVRALGILDGGDLAAGLQELTSVDVGQVATTLPEHAAALTLGALASGHARLHLHQRADAIRDRLDRLAGVPGTVQVPRWAAEHWARWAAQVAARSLEPVALADAAAQPEQLRRAGVLAARVTALPPALAPEPVRRTACGVLAVEAAYQEQPGRALELLGADARGLGAGLPALERGLIELAATRAQGSLGIANPRPTLDPGTPPTSLAPLNLVVEVARTRERVRLARQAADELGVHLGRLVELLARLSWAALDLAAETAERHLGSPVGVPATVASARPVTGPRPGGGARLGGAGTTGEASDAGVTVEVGPPAVAHRPHDGDPRTGAATGSGTDSDELAEAVRRSLRFGSLPVSVALVEVGGLTSLTRIDADGVGGQVLAGVVGALTGQLRDTDRLARVTPDQFAVLLPRTDAEQARQAAERLARAVSEVVVAGDIGHRLEVRSGAASLTAPGSRRADTEAQDLLRRADLSLQVVPPPSLTPEPRASAPAPAAREERRLRGRRAARYADPTQHATAAPAAPAAPAIPMLPAVPVLPAASVAPGVLPPPTAPAMPAATAPGVPLPPPAPMSPGATPWSRSAGMPPPAATGPTAPAAVPVLPGPPAPPRPTPPSLHPALPTSAPDTAPNPLGSTIPPVPPAATPAAPAAPAPVAARAALPAATAPAAPPSPAGPLPEPVQPQAPQRPVDAPQAPAASPRTGRRAGAVEPPPAGAPSRRRPAVIQLGQTEPAHGRHES